jgi:hypothetical protein
MTPALAKRMTAVPAIFPTPDGDTTTATAEQVHPPREHFPQHARARVCQGGRSAVGSPVCVARRGPHTPGRPRSSGQKENFYVLPVEVSHPPRRTVFRMPGKPLHHHRTAGVTNRKVLTNDLPRWRLRERERE